MLIRPVIEIRRKMFNISMWSSDPADEMFLFFLFVNFSYL